MSADTAEVSEDAVLGGRLILHQPRRGHRFGHDAILLAAAVEARESERAVELGAGVGAAGLALAHRVDGLAVILIERDAPLAELAHTNAARNHLADRVRAVCLDVAASPADFAAAGLPAETFDHVLMNPPFNPPQNPSPDAARRAAYVANDDTLVQWLRVAARLLRPAGEVTAIWRADGLAELLDALGSGFGAIAILPIFPKPGASAIRVLARARKGSKAPLKLSPGLTLADADGTPSRAAQAVLREGAALSFDA